MANVTEKPNRTWQFYFFRVGATLSVLAGLLSIKILVQTWFHDLTASGQQLAALAIAGAEAFPWMFGIWTIYKIWDREIGRAPASNAASIDSAHER